MAAEKVCLTREKETYLATLYGEPLDAAADNPISPTASRRTRWRASTTTSRS